MQENRTSRGAKSISDEECEQIVGGTGEVAVSTTDPPPQPESEPPETYITFEIVS